MPRFFTDTDFQSTPIIQSKSRASIQPCTYDLSIGEIWASSFEGDMVQVEVGVLDPGGTAHIRTREELIMSPKHFGVCYALNRSARDGLLVINTGHVDPGYHGPLHFTVVNMGKDRKILSVNDAIASLMICELDNPVANPLSSSGGDGVPGAVAHLAPDFMHLTKRISAQVSKAEWMHNAKVGFLAALVTVGATWLLNNGDAHTKITDSIKKNATEVVNMKEKIGSIESEKRRAELDALLKNIEALKVELNQQERRLMRIEDRAAISSSTQKEAESNGN